MSSRFARYIRHTHQPPTDLDAAKTELQNALTASLDDIQHRSNKDAPSDHVYVGSAGTALMRIYISGLFVDRDIQQRVLEPGRLTPSSFKFPRDAAHASFLETTIGNATLLLERYISGRRTTEISSCMEILQRSLLLAKASVVDDDGCELLYGRAGLLYAFLRVRAALKAAENLNPDTAALVSDDNLAILAESIMARGWLGASWYSADISQDGPPLMWSWHGKRYLGAAHGVAGILNVLLLCPSTVLKPYLQDILTTIDWLISIQEEDGNWPSKAPVKRESEANNLIQWCHGAPGIVMLISTLVLRVPLSQDLCRKIHASLQRGASLTYRHGLLRKGVGICHGVAGSVYTLLSAVAAFGALGQDGLKEKYFSRAIHLAQLATNYQQFTQEGQMRVPDRPFSLYEGLAGMSCAWAEILHQMNGGTFGGVPGFGETFLFSL